MRSIKSASAARSAISPGRTPREARRQARTQAPASGLGGKGKRQRSQGRHLAPLWRCDAQQQEFTSPQPLPRAGRMVSPYGDAGARGVGRRSVAQLFRGMGRVGRAAPVGRSRARACSSRAGARGTRRPSQSRVRTGLRRWSAPLAQIYTGPATFAAADPFRTSIWKGGLLAARRAYHRAR
jgi:hypothetical protein